jgi:hypothetical protein
MKVYKSEDIVKAIREKMNSTQMKDINADKIIEYYARIWNILNGYM